MIFERASVVVCGTLRRVAPRVALAPALFLLLALAPSGCGAREGGRDAGSDARITCSARYAAIRRRSEPIVILDRSCAMRDRFDGSGAATGPIDVEGRWGAAREALLAISSEGPASGWGLAFVPDDPTSCVVDALRVEPAPGNGAALREVIANDGVVDPFVLCGGGASEVPIESALIDAVGGSDLLGASGGEPLTIVIAAGDPGCGATVESLALAAQAPGGEVAVVVLGAPGATADALYEALATAGGSGPVGPPSYYLASSADELTTTLRSIVDDHASCIFDLDGPVEPDPEMIRVWVDGAEIPGDPDEGFAFSPGDRSIVLNGSLCDRLLAGSLRRIDVASACDTPACVAREEVCDSLDDDCDDRVDEGCT